MGRRSKKQKNFWNYFDSRVCLGSCKNVILYHQLNWGAYEMIRAIIFDIDGTLYDESYPKVKAELLTAEYIASKTHMEPDRIYNVFREVKSYFTSLLGDAHERNDRGIWYEETFSRLGITGITKQEASAFYWNVVTGCLEPYLDFLHVAPYLSKKYNLYTLTDEFFEISKKKLAAIGLEKYFNTLISAEQVGETKPSKKLFDYALGVIGSNPDEIVVVGDNPSADVKGGNGSGMFTAWLRRGKYYYYPLKGLEKPDIEFTNYVQLPKKIEELGCH